MNLTAKSDLTQRWAKIVFEKLNKVLRKKNISSRIGVKLIYDVKAEQPFLG